MNPQLARIRAWLRGRPATAARLREMVVAMRASGLGPATCNRYLSALAADLRDRGQRLPAMPWQREPMGRQRTLSPDEVLRLRAAILPRCPRSAALVGFLAETGMRVSEALTLTAEDVSGVWATVRTSKNGSGRRVPLTAEALRSWAAGFTGLGQSRFNHEFRRGRDQVEGLRGDPEVVPHGLRHTCASRLVNTGVSLPVVGTWLGHRSLRSTARYAHTSQEGLMDAAKRLESA